MSFHEKSAWVMFGILGFVYGSYFLKAWALWSGGFDTMEAYLRLMSGAVILLVILVIGFHIMVATLDPAARRKDYDKKDERDRLYRMRGDYYSGWILGAGAITALLYAMQEGSYVVIAHLILGSLVISEMVSLGLMIRYYRRGY